ncbi:MAG: hypothetical protein ACI32O_03580 [Enterococcus sp.]
MKKTTLGVALALATLTSTLFGDLSASAQVINNSDPSNNPTGVIQDSAIVKITGEVGGDNTDPETQYPEGDPRWINVELPDGMVFASDASNDTVATPAGTYNIINHSARGVKTTIVSFNGSDTDSIEILNEAFNTLTLDVKDDVNNSMSADLLAPSGENFDLTPGSIEDGNRGVTTAPAGSGATAELNIKGDYDGQKVSNTAVTYELGLEFEALPK